MPPYTEVAWRGGKYLTHITDSIEAMVGFTADEVREMGILDLIAPSHVPAVIGLMNGGTPNQIVSRTLSDFILRHKAGHPVCCQVTLICRYDGNGNLTELFGAARQLPDHRQFTKVEAWWLEAPQLVRQVIHDSLALFPAPA